MEAVIYNREAKEVGKLNLSESVFGLKWNADLVHQVIVSMGSNARSGLAHAKTRGEVSGGGKKPWQQKGTGRARHGSIRSPIWVGGGVAHGPRSDKNYTKKINQKMKTKALFTILSAKLRDGEIIFVDSLGLGAPKTKQAKQVLDNFAAIKNFKEINYKKGHRVLVLTAQKSEPVRKSLRNLKATAVEEVRNLNPLLALSYKFLLIESPKESLPVITGRMVSKIVEKAPEDVKTAQAPRKRRTSIKKTPALVA